MLLGQAFVALGLCAMKKPSLSLQEQMALALYELECAVNRVRNREGAGHGRPFVAINHAGAGPNGGAEHGTGSGDAFGRSVVTRMIVPACCWGARVQQTMQEEACAS